LAETPSAVLELKVPGDTPHLELDCPPHAPKVRLLTLGDLDKRTNAAKRARDLIERVAGDLGGQDQISVAESQIVQRAVLLGCMAEDLEAKWLSGEDVDASVLATIANAQRRLFESVGLKRRPRDVTPRLSDYLADRA
jgi:hypothetical protein